MSNQSRLISGRVNASKQQTRSITELVGICRGIVFDNEVSQAEAENLFKWLNMQPGLLEVWPANVLYSRLEEVLQDGVVDQEEAQSLLKMLTDLVGDEGGLHESVDISTGEITATGAPVSLPVSTPEEIKFDHRRFVLTGEFYCGTRAECKDEIESRGGIIVGSVSKVTDFLIIGAAGSEDWIQSNWGRKIEKAIEYQNRGLPIQLIHESHWVELLKRC